MPGVQLSYIRDALQKSLDENVRAGNVSRETLFAVTDDSLERLSRYASELSSWSKRVDLVSVAPAEVLVDRHIVDSVTVAWVLYSAGYIGESFVLLDIGSGAGLPGLVFSCLFPEAECVLLEPREKRTVFLAEMRRVLSLRSCTVITSRIEDYDPPRRFTLATGRALGKEVDFFPRALPILDEGGAAALLASSASEVVGQVSLPYRIPSADQTRFVIVKSVSRETLS